MQHVEVTRRLPASPETTWQVYTDHAGWKRWSGFQHTTLETSGTPDANGSGAVRCFGSNGVNAYEEVLEFEPPRRMTYTILRGGLPITNHLGEVTLQPDGDGTILTWRCRFDSKIPGLGWLQRIIIQRVFATALAGLERFLGQADPAGTNSANT